MTILASGRFETVLRATDRDRQRFWRRVTKTSTCWLWDKAASGGYGWFWFGKKGYTAHHVAKIWDEKPIAGRHVCRHQCANKRCVNPAHLKWGTHHENMQDISPNIVTNKGESRLALSSWANITQTQAQRIFAAYHHQNATMEQLSDEFNLHLETVRVLLKRSTWKKATAIFDPKADRPVRKIRGPKGRLSESDVIAILEANQAQVMSKSELAGLYGVSCPHIVMLCQGKTWPATVQAWREANGIV